VSDRPLAGRHVVVTRTRERAAGLVDRLHALGADVSVVPLIATVPLAPPDAVKAVASEVKAGPGERWAVFTSATAVRLVTRVLDRIALQPFAIAALGRETAAALSAAGCVVSLVPDRHDGEGLADALVLRGVGGAAVWLPTAEGAGSVLPDRLRAAGAHVRVQAVYRSDMPAGAADRLQRVLRRGVDAIALTSGSTARHLVRALAGAELPARTVVVCIGPQTAAVARAAGLRVDLVAVEQSADGIASALSAHFATLP